MTSGTWVRSSFATRPHAYPAQPCAPCFAVLSLKCGTLLTTLTAVWRWQDLEGLKIRLTARNIKKVLQTFMNTTERQVDMWMDGCDGTRSTPHPATAHSLNSLSIAR